MVIIETIKSRECDTILWMLLRMMQNGLDDSTVKFFFGHIFSCVCFFLFSATQYRREPVFNSFKIGILKSAKSSVVTYYKTIVDSSCACVCVCALFFCFLLISPLTDYIRYSCVEFKYIDQTIHTHVRCLYLEFQALNAFKYICMCE